MKRSILFFSAAILLTSCGETKKAPLKGVVVRSVVLKGDNGELVRSALLDRLVTTGVQRSNDNGIDLVGQIKWEGEDGDQPAALYVTVGSAEKAEYTFSVAVEVRRGQPGLRGLANQKLNDKFFARMAALNVVEKMIEQYDNQRSEPAPDAPQHINPRPPGG